jgi:hypothetical protein
VRERFQPFRTNRVRQRDMPSADSGLHAFLPAELTEQRSKGAGLDKNGDRSSNGRPSYGHTLRPTDVHSEPRCAAPPEQPDDDNKNPVDR